MHVLFSNLYFRERKKKRHCTSLVYITKSVICVKLKAYDIEIKIKKISACDIAHLISLRTPFTTSIVSHCFSDTKRLSWIAINDYTEHFSKILSYSKKKTC